MGIIHKMLLPVSLLLHRDLVCILLEDITFWKGVMNHLLVLAAVCQVQMLIPEVFLGTK